MYTVSKFNLDNPTLGFQQSKTELIVATFAINILSLAMPIMVLQVYDRITSHHSVSTLTVLATGVILMVIFESILRIARAYTTSWAAAVYEYTISTNAMRYYLNANPKYAKLEGTGSQIQNLMSLSNLKDVYSGQHLVSLIDVPFSIIFIILIWYLTGYLVLVPLTLLALFGIFTWYMGGKLRNILDKQGDIDDKRYDFIIEVLQGIHTIKSFGMESLFQRRYERLEEDLSIADYKTATITTRCHNFGIIFNEIIIVATVSSGAPMVINNYFTTGALIAAVLIVGRLMQPIQRVIVFWNSFQDAILSSDKAEKIFSIPQIKRQNIKVTSSSGIVKITNLSFGYGKKNIFTNLNFETNYPEAVAIYGESDSGRSILLQLIAGILKPDAGSVKVNGYDSHSYCSESLVKNVGLITHDNVIFKGSVMENLTAFNILKEEQAIEIVKILSLDKEIALMPHGYDTQIQDGVVDALTPGIKQRIAIARILINKPKIILFNNADKGLDREGYNQLIKLLNLIKGQATIIIITDDNNINCIADRHYLIKDYKIQEIPISDSFLYRSSSESISKLTPYHKLQL